MSAVSSGSCHYALLIAYCGTPFEGYQKQPHGNTIQDHLEKALGKIFDHPIQLLCAGRTDTGVHARGQVCSFSSPHFRDPNKIFSGLRGLLPPGIWCYQAVQLKEPFHPRFQALSRSYRYLISLDPKVCPSLEGKVWYPKITAQTQFCDTSLKKVCQQILGRHNFVTFSYKPNPQQNPVRDLLACHARPIQGPWGQPILELEITANGFLRRMVRRLTGALWKVYTREWTPQDFKDRKQAQDPCQGPVSLPSEGLYFWSVDYGNTPLFH